MNKNDLVKALSGKSKLSRREVNQVLSGAFEMMARASKREQVTILGLGTFKPVKRKAKRCRSPKSGRMIKVPAYKTVKYVPAVGLKRF